VTPLADKPTTYPVILTGDLLEGALYSALYMKVHDLIPLIVDHAELPLTTSPASHPITPPTMTRMRKQPEHLLPYLPQFPYNPPSYTDST
jgi:hypothetical protein